MAIIRRLPELPTATRFMPRAVWPKPKRVELPSITLELAPRLPPRGALARYLELTGQRAGHTLPLAWPQVWGFRLQMALLTEPHFPLPIWRGLQIRNRIVQHAALPPDARYGLIVRTHRLRRLDKGVEVDLHCALHEDAHERPLVWESLTTYFWRGRHGAAHGSASPDDASPTVDGDVVASWNCGNGAGWRFGALTGDYNGVHWSDWYARAFGFARAFHHPARIAGHCLARLGAHSDAAQQQFELWIKGPVYYRSEVRLRARAAGRSRLFALHVEGDARPALVGRWRPGRATLVSGDG